MKFFSSIFERIKSAVTKAAAFVQQKPVMSIGMAMASALVITLGARYISARAVVVLPPVVDAHALQNAQKQGVTAVAKQVASATVSINQEKKNPLDSMDLQSRGVADKILAGQKIIADRTSHIYECQNTYDNISGKCVIPALKSPEDLASKPYEALNENYAQIIEQDQSSQQSLGKCNERKSVIDSIVLLSKETAKKSEEQAPCRAPSETADKEESIDTLKKSSIESLVSHKSDLQAKLNAYKNAVRCDKLAGGAKSNKHGLNTKSKSAN